MKNNQTGMVLFATLSMIIVLTLLLLTYMQQTLLYSKAINQNNLIQNDFYGLEKIAENILHDTILSTNPRCMQKSDRVNAVINQLKNSGCKITDYRYIIEDLGNLDCLVIHQKSQIFASRHKRLSILKVDNGNYLQLRIITSSLKSSRCKKALHYGKIGVSSWRTGKLA